MSLLQIGFCGNETMADRRLVLVPSSGSIADSVTLRSLLRPQDHLIPQHHRLSTQGTCSGATGKLVMKVFVFGAGYSVDGSTNNL